jgi:hypothetical protein
LGSDEPLRLAGGNPDDADATGQGDLLAERAWKSALVGFLGIPFAFHAWSLLLLQKAYAAGGPLTDRGRTCARRALVVSSCMVVAWSAILVRIFAS